MKLLGVLLVFLGFSLVINGYMLSIIQPSTTDSNIDTYDFGNYVYYPEASDAALKSNLFFFIGGTSSVPADYSGFLSHHATMGYRVMSVSYPNPQTINTYCQSTSSSGTCYSDVRNEILYGEDLSNLVSINPANSINNRFLKLLIYMNSLFPTQGWNNFYNNASQKINWNSIIVAGHSQGAGFAGFIGVNVTTRRVIQYGGVTDLYSDGVAPSWSSLPPATPREEFFGFRTKYEFVCMGELANWANFQMANWGTPANIETALAPFSNTHMICSSFKPKLGVQLFPLGLVAHNDYIVDNWIPTTRLTLYQGVWTYLATLGSCEGNCTNGTFCTAAGTCESLSNINTAPDTCGCEPGPLGVNPGFLAIVIIIPLVFCIAIIVCIVCCCKKSNMCNGGTKIVD